jgi:hypothetical protein
MSDRLSERRQAVLIRTAEMPIPVEIGQDTRSHIELLQPFLKAIQKFSRVWWSNRHDILHLTAVNIVVTIFMEAAVRTLLSKVDASKSGFEFLIPDVHGYRVNQQSMTNVWITTFTSIFGGPVYFLERRSHRYIYFALFGMCVSAASQMVAAISVGYSILSNIAAAKLRFLFDLIYNCTFKFGMFEMMRGPILKQRVRLSMRLGRLRMTQDFSTTLVRVFLLNLLGLSG